MREVVLRVSAARRTGARLTGVPLESGLETESYNDSTRLLDRMNSRRHVVFASPLQVFGLLVAQCSPEAERGVGRRGRVTASLVFGHRSHPLFRTPRFCGHGPVQVSNPKRFSDGATNVARLPGLAREAPVRKKSSVLDFRVLLLKTPAHSTLLACHARGLVVSARGSEAIAWRRSRHESCTRSPRYSSRSA
jgi:hypothetical protein